MLDYRKQYGKVGRIVLARLQNHHCSLHMKNLHMILQTMFARRDSRLAALRCYSRVVRQTVPQWTTTIRSMEPSHIKAENSVKSRPNLEDLMQHWKRE